MATPRQGDGGVLGPSDGGGAGCGQHLVELLVGRGFATRPCGPGDHSPRLPRDLELHVAHGLEVGRLVDDSRLFERGIDLSRQPLPGGGQSAALGLEVGDDLVPLLTPDRAGVIERLLGVVEEPEDRRAPPRPVGFERAELLVGDRAIGFGLDVHLELPTRQGAGGNGTGH